MEKKKRSLKKMFGLTALICIMTLFFGMTTMAQDKVEKINPVKALVTNADKNQSVNHYYKFTIKKSGIMELAAQASTGIYTTGLNVSICNGKKKVLDTRNVTEKGREFIGLKKGTYYLKVKTPYEYKMACVFTKIADTSGSSFGRATALKKNAAKKGIIAAGESGKKIDYFKFTLTKPQRVTLVISALANSDITFKVIPAKSVKIMRSTVSRSIKNGSMNLNLYSGAMQNLPVGTYYVKVFRANSSSKVNGCYSIGWK